MSTTVTLSHRARQRGMTLVEVMVGVAIGLIAMIVMFQTLTVWDQRTRASSSGSDAQVTGTIAMYNLERDLRLAGMGFGEAGLSGLGGSSMGCTVTGFDGSASAVVGFPLRGVSIVDGTATNTPDQISTLYGNSPYFNSGATVTSTSAHSLTVKAGRVGFKAGDLAVVTGPLPANCTLVEVTDDATAADFKTLKIDQTSSYPNYYKSTAVPSRYNTASGVGAAGFDGGIYSLGPLPHRNTWKVLNGVLGFSDDLGVVPSAFFPVADGVVDLKAFYGYDADNDGRIADSEWTKNLPSAADWRLIRAVKVVMLVRSKQFGAPGEQRRRRQVRGAEPELRRRCGLRTHEFRDGRRGRYHRLQRRGQPEQLALLPLRRLPEDRSRPQPQLGPTGGRALMNTLRIRTHSRIRRNAERGVVLFVAMIVLVVMALAGVAMVRQSTTGVSIAGNLAFRQNALSAGDFGTEAARAWWLAQQALPAGLDSDLPAQGYYSDWGAAGNARRSGDPTLYDWNTAKVATTNDGTNNEVRYIVERLCLNPNTTIDAAGQLCVTTPSVGGGDKSSACDNYPRICLDAPSVVNYRISSRVVGPKNTTSYIQVMLN